MLLASVHGAVASSAAPTLPVLWTPTALTTAQWLDAADGSTFTISTGVSQWRDKSGNLRHYSQSTSWRQPARVVGLNDLSVVRFADEDHNLRAYDEFLIGVNFTFFAAIGRSASPGGYWYGIDEFGLSMGWNLSTSYRINQHGPQIFASTVPAYSAGVSDIICYEHSSSTGKKLLFNGTQVGSSANTSHLDETGWSYLGTNFYESEPFHGDIAEIVIITGSLGGENKERIEGYLAHKWGLAGQLPGDHPYKSNPPYL